MEPPGGGSATDLQGPDKALPKPMAPPGIAELVEAENHYRALSHIEDICLLSRAKNDGRKGGLFAVIVPDGEELSARKVASARQRLGELLEIAGCVLPAPLRVSDLVLIDEPLPRDRDGKLCREEIACRYANGASPEIGNASADRLLEEPASRRFLARLEEVLGIRGPFSLRQNLESDLGMDSLRHIQLRIVLEEEFGVAVADEDLWRIETVGDVLERVAGASPHDGGERVELSWGHLLRQPAATQFQPQASPNIASWAFFGLVRQFVKAILRVFYRAKVSGLEKLPRSGPLLLCPNHLSYLDSPIMFCLMPARLISRTCFLAYKEIFRVPPLTWMIRGCRLILTGDAESALDSLKQCHRVLEKGEAVCVFPEGIRSTTGTLMPAKPGIGMLACEAQAPIVPILIEGSEATMSPPNPGLHFCRIRIVVGNPFPAPQGDHFTVSDYQAMADRWREAVLRLRNEPALS